jgi:hypothetical protein
LIKNIQPFTPLLRKAARLNASQNPLPVIEQAITPSWWRRKQATANDYISANRRRQTPPDLITGTLLRSEGIGGTHNI